MMLHCPASCGFTQLDNRTCGALQEVLQGQAGALRRPLAFCSYSDADYEARLRGHKKGLQHDAYNRSASLTVASLTGESMSRRGAPAETTAT